MDVLSFAWGNKNKAVRKTKPENGEKRKSLPLSLRNEEMTQKFESESLGLTKKCRKLLRPRSINKFPSFSPVKINFRHVQVHLSEIDEKE